MRTGFVFKAKAAMRQGRASLGTVLALLKRQAICVGGEGRKPPDIPMPDWPACFNVNRATEFEHVWPNRVKHLFLLRTLLSHHKTDQGAGQKIKTVLTKCTALTNGTFEWLQQFSRPVRSVCCLCTPCNTLTMSLEWRFENSLLSPGPVLNGLATITQRLDVTA